MFKRLCLSLCLLSSLPAAARDPDTELAAAVTLHTMDWLQTRKIAANLHHLRETNQILGAKPSMAHVNKYFAATMLGGIAAHYLLPEKYAKWSDRIWISVEAGAVAHNFGMGIGFKF